MRHAVFSVPVPMVRIGEMGVRMRHRRVAMTMGVPGTERNRLIMRMLVMFIVLMLMFMFQSFVRMFMAVSLGQM